MLGQKQWQILLLQVSNIKCVVLQNATEESCHSIFLFDEIDAKEMQENSKQGHGNNIYGVLRDGDFSNIELKVCQCDPTVEPSFCHRRAPALPRQLPPKSTKLAARKWIQSLERRQQPRTSAISPLAVTPPLVLHSAPPNSRRVSSFNTNCVRSRRYHHQLLRNNDCRRRIQSGGFLVAKWKE